MAKLITTETKSEANNYVKKSKMDYLDFNIEKRSLESIFVDFIKKEKDD